MKLASWLLAATAILTTSPAFSELSRTELEEALRKNPDILMDVLRENRQELLEVVSQAASEARAQDAKTQAKAQEEEFEKAFENPMTPKVGSDTRIRGNPDAPFTLVEYSDFQCPYCARGYQTVRALREKYGDQLRFVYKHLPLDIHPEAMPSARYMEAISLQSQDLAWKFHDAIFENQKQMGHDFYLDTAKKLGVNVEKMLKDADSTEILKIIAEDSQEARSFKFTGTPGFLLNGIPVRGAYPPAKFEEIIERLKRKAKGDTPEQPE